MAVVFWLDLTSLGPSAETLTAELEALGRLASELDVRFAGAGLGGIEGAVALHERLRAVLDGLRAEDLDRMARQVAAVERALTEIRERLHALRELKALLDDLEPKA
jgi:NADH dehydrogenase FAD-containing subunit